MGKDDFQQWSQASADSDIIVKEMKEVSHIGRIVSIDRYVTQVEIISGDACGECHAKELCGYSASGKKTVPVPTDAFAMHSVGDEVELCMKRSMGMKAVWISYVIPLVILMVAILILNACSLGELVTGLGAIAAVAVYYLILLLFRDALKNEFEFYIK